jgi:hypothetical protein
VATRRCRASGVSDVCVHVFHLDATYVTMAIYTCCKRMFHVEAYVSGVLNVCFVFHLDVA